MAKFEIRERFMGPEMFKEEIGLVVFGSKLWEKLRAREDGTFL